MKKKKIIIVLIVLLIIISLIAVLIINYRAKQVPKHNHDPFHSTEIDEFTEMEVKIYQEEKKEMIKPLGYYMLVQNYQGRNDLEVFYKINKSLYDEIITLSALDEIDFDEYYKENKTEIEEKMPITNIDEFANYLKSIDKLTTLDVGIGAEIDTDSFESVDSYLVFDMKLIYKEEELNFKVQLQNLKRDEQIVEYTFVEK